MATGGTLAASDGQAANGGQAASGGDDQAGGTPSLGGSPAGGSDSPGGGEAGATSAGAGGASGAPDLETIAADVAAVCAIGPQKCAVFDVEFCEQASAPMANDPCLVLYADRMDCLADLPASGFYCVEDNVIAVLPDGPCQEVMDEHETCLGG